MNKIEAVEILERELVQYRKLPYSDLVKKMGEQETFEKINERGEKFQVEVDFFFDNEEEKTIRVLAMLSYSLWTDFSPVSRDFIVAPNGKFVGE